MSKRILSLFMALVLCVSMLPTSVLAGVDSTLETVEAITEVEAAEQEEPAAEDSEDPSTEESDAGKELSPRSEELDETASLAALESVEYIDKDGSKATCEDYTLLTGDPDGNTLDGTNGEVWYVLSGSFSATADWTVYGNVNLILMDGTTCSTDGHYVQLKDKSVLSVYGQEKVQGFSRSPTLRSMAQGSPLSAVRPQATARRGFPSSVLLHFTAEMCPSKAPDTTP